VRPTREYYARASATVDGVECHLGLELQNGDDVSELTGRLQDLAESALRWADGQHQGTCRAIEIAVEVGWPGRAFFVETETEGRGVQVFQPYGLPRDR